MQKAFEFLGPIGTALAAVVSFLMLRRPDLSATKMNPKNNVTASSC